MPRRRPDFEPDSVGAEAVKLRKFSDAGGSQKQWLSDAGRNRFLKSFVYTGFMEKPIWITPITLDDINHRARGTLSDHLGIEFTNVGDDHLVATMPIDQRTLQPMGIMHGGASCALAETVGSAAANYCIDQREKVCVGLDININHIRPVRSGIVTAVAKPLHLGKTTQVWEIKIHNEQKQLVSAARLTLAVIGKKIP